jgi:methionyl-tRNA formyltransferase
MKIIMLAGSDFASTMVFNALREKYNIEKVIVEPKEDKLVFLKRRMKKLGFFTVAGQVLFQLIIVKYLNLVSKKRTNEIISEKKLFATTIDPSQKIEVESVNDDIAIQHIKNLAPDLIVINGTRILSKKLLASVNCKIINAHAGITPAYRGVHGAYWALVNKDPENVGVTTHFVDSGIDTGAIIYQRRTVITAKDNFVTYPLLQLANSIDLLKTSMDAIINNSVVIKQNTMDSRLWYHPTFWGYICNRIIRGVK